MGENLVLLSSRNGTRKMRPKVDPPLVSRFINILTSYKHLSKPCKITVVWFCSCNIDVNF